MDHGHVRDDVRVIIRDWRVLVVLASLIAIDGVAWFRIGFGGGTKQHRGTIYPLDTGSMGLVDALSGLPRMWIS